MSNYCSSLAGLFRSACIVVLTCIPLAAQGDSGWKSDSAGFRPAREDWKAARQQVASDPQWRRWMQDEMAALDAWIAGPKDGEDQNAGWIHDFQEQHSGSFRHWTPSVDCDSAADRQSRVWRACVALRRHKNIEMMRNAARLATLTETPRHADWAAAQLDMYARLLARRQDAQFGKPALFQQGLDEANVLPVLADTVRLLRPMAGAARPQRWCSELLRPMAVTMLGLQKQVHNIAVWYASAAAVAGMECNDGELLAQTKSGPWSLPRLLEEGMSADGFWFELSLGYQNYVLRALNEFLLAASLRGREDLLGPIPAAARALIDSPAKVRFSAGDAPTINDSNRYLKIPDEALLKHLRRVIPTAEGLRVAQRERDWDLLLDAPAGIAAAPSAVQQQQPGGRKVPGLESLFLQSGRWHALLRAGQKAPFHAHQDSLSLELKHGDTWLLRNSVTPAYGSDLHRKFYKLASARNTPLVNGLGISNWFAEAADTQAAADSIGAEFKSFQRGANVRRTLAVAGAVLEDRLDFKATARNQLNSYGSIYHTDCTVIRPAGRMEALGLPSTPGFEYFEATDSWRAAAPGFEWDARLECGGQGFNLRVKASAPVALTLASVPALAPARKRSALLISMDKEGDASLQVRIEAEPERGEKR